MRRGKFRDALIDGPRIGHVTKSKIVVDGRGRDLLWHIGVGQECAQFGRKNQRAASRFRVVKRFFSEAIARKEEKLSVTVPKGKGKHPRKTLEAPGTPALPSVYDSFGIAAGPKRVTVSFKLVAEG